MSQIIKVTVNGTQYNLRACSAVEQRRISLTLGKYGLSAMLQALALADPKDPESVKLAVVGIVAKVMERMPIAEAESVMDTVFQQCFKHGTETAMVIDDFTGELETYYQIVFRALGEQFKGFSKLLSQQKG